MAKATTDNPRSLLDFVIALIARDLGHISKDGENKKLVHDTASDLARYSTALLNIIKDLDSQAEESRKGLSRLTTEELMEKAEKVLEEMKNGQ